MSGTNVEGKPYYVGVRLRLVRDGTVLVDSHPGASTQATAATLSKIDQPPAGSRTYILYAQVIGAGSWMGGGAASVGRNIIDVTGLKK
jgi:hypothetical protein